MVKVQRPRIERLVETDLAALRLAMSWLKLYRPIARRVDLDRLYDEFSPTTRAELDFVAEGHNAERFAADFADDPGVYIADVFWEYTTRRVLTLENVASIKINDFAAIEAAGISRPHGVEAVRHLPGADLRPPLRPRRPASRQPVRASAAARSRSASRLAHALPAHLRRFRHGRGDPGTAAERPARLCHRRGHA